MDVIIDPSTTLCLACSASLPPNLRSKTSQTKLHTTNCCKRPICPSCIESNPRLARYDPCLMCLQGVDLVSASSSRSPGMLSPRSPPLLGRLNERSVNLNGAMRDEDAFIVGDEHSDDEEVDEEVIRDDVTSTDSIPSSAPPGYDEAGMQPPAITDSAQHSSTSLAAEPVERTTDDQWLPLDLSSMNLPPTPSELDSFEAQERKSRSAPYKYYLNKTDTLQGLSLRFAVDAREICKLNLLPTSTIRTTPHLLHTRAFLLLPPSAKPHPSLELTKEEEARREEEIVRERAETRLQTLMKEVDWRVAKAYVAVASIEDEALVKLKLKEEGTSRAKGVTALALERYLDDEEWEARERRLGRTPLDITHGNPPSPFKIDSPSISKLLASESGSRDRDRK
ncbi:hypothetical protein CVT24_008769 [Panaeolus cyanescens]|uniref:LysM domain-containing protein n=1 Tax=Panaeolus cyanescens TaxID=181874 RepID=A0A409VCU8_9AGAR|nr:hypothetical protein CVT24_008769 [Panaeolus cyanescens]